MSYIIMSITSLVNVGIYRMCISPITRLTRRHKTVAALVIGSIVGIAINFFKNKKESSSNISHATFKRHFGSKAETTIKEPRQRVAPIHPLDCHFNRDKPNAAIPVDPQAIQNAKMLAAERYTAEHGNLFQNAARKVKKIATCIFGAVKRKDEKLFAAAVRYMEQTKKGFFSRQLLAMSSEDRTRYLDTLGTNGFLSCINDNISESTQRAACLQEGQSLGMDYKRQIWASCLGSFPTSSQLTSPVFLGAFPTATFAEKASNGTFNVFNPMERLLDLFPDKELVVVSVQESFENQDVGDSARTRPWQKQEIATLSYKMQRGIRRIWKESPDQKGMKVSVLNDLAETINDGMKAGHIVYIHCKSGHGRSNAGVCAALIKYQIPTETIKDLYNSYVTAPKTRNTQAKQPYEQLAERLVNNVTGFTHAIRPAASLQGAKGTPFAAIFKPKDKDLIQFVLDYVFTKERFPEIYQGLKDDMADKICEKLAVPKKDKVRIKTSLLPQIEECTDSFMKTVLKTLKPSGNEDYAQQLTQAIKAAKETN